MKKDHAEKKRQNSENEPNDTLSTEESIETATPSLDEAAAALEAECARLKEDYLRVLAESENIKKRCAAEIDKNNKYAVASFAKDLLGVADNLSRALEAGKNANREECAGILEGVSLTEAELTHVFSKFGIEPMDTLGKVFDPNYHRVVQELEDPSQPAGTVLAELQKGYLINGRLLREAMVVVSKA